MDDCKIRDLTVNKIVVKFIKIKALKCKKYLSAFHINLIYFQLVPIFAWFVRVIVLLRFSYR
ncbi:hypothetical protein GCM10010896_18590 [Mammaliicoccus stepanovicii]|nr:hypothetical protein GCM10010896_18590 [Mammaliicoccus stepanovicii]